MASISMLVCISQMTYAQKANAILQSSNIEEVENYLKQIHPDDPKKLILKKRIIEIKNKVWTEGAKNATTMKPRLIDPEDDIKFLNNELESEKYKNFMAITDLEHTDKTVSRLNTMFNNEPMSKECLLLVKNSSNYNMILRINGNLKYKLAIPSHGENTIVVDKGDYTMVSNVCGAPYTSQKTIIKSLVIDLTQANPSQSVKNSAK